MKALWIESAGTVRYGELPDPMPPAGWVRLKILAASVCGSDLNVYKFGRQYHVEKRVSGHEFAGVIDQVGDKTSKWKVGQRVCVYPQLYCGVCEDCKEGSINMCGHRKFIGGRDYNGGFAEYAVVPEYVLMEVPESVSDIEAAMAEPFAVGLHAVNQAGGPRLKGKTLVIYGAGPIGLFAMEAAKYYGVKQIIMLDMVEEKLKIAREHGATDIIPAAESAEMLQEKVMELTGQRGADAVVDAVCLDVTINNSMHFCRPHGIISVVGLAKANCTVDFRYLVSHELTITGSYTYTTEMQDCLKILESGAVKTEYIANPVVSLQDGVETFEKLVKKPEECLKAVFIPGMAEKP